LLTQLCDGIDNKDGPNGLPCGTFVSVLCLFSDDGARIADLTVPWIHTLNINKQLIIV
jgi:hypothetical protein